MEVEHACQDQAYQAQEAVMETPLSRCTTPRGGIGYNQAALAFGGQIHMLPVYLQSEDLY